MAVQHAFWIAGGSRGVAQRRCAAFVEDRPAVARIALRDEALIRFPIVHAVIREDHDALDRRQARHQPARKRDERRIDEQHPGLRVFEDVDELLLEKTGIDRMQDGPDPRHAVKQFEVPVTIHRKRGNAIAALHAGLQQRARELAGAWPGLAVSIAMRSPVLVAGHDLAARMVLLSVADEVADHQLLVLHQPEDVAHSAADAWMVLPEPSAWRIASAACGLSVPRFRPSGIVRSASMR